MKKNVLSIAALMAMAPGIGRRGPQFCLEVEENIAENCDSNVPGLVDEIYLIPESDVEALGALTSVSPTFKNNYQIAAAHTLVTDKAWLKVDLAEGTGKFSFEGPKKRMGNFKAKLEGTIPGVNETAIGLANNMARKKVYAIGINRAKNAYYHIGYSGCAASFDLTGDTDVADGNGLGVKFEINATQPYLYTWKSTNAITTY